MRWMLAGAGLAMAPTGHMALAMPDARDVAEAVGHALGSRENGDAYSISDCTANPAGPGYVCTFSVDECVIAGLDESECDNPGIDQRALFVGGDNGWLALDIRGPHEEGTPRQPLDPTSPLLHDVSEQWLEGTWDVEGNCQNDGIFTLAPRNRYRGGFARGGWMLDGNRLAVTIAERVLGAEGDPMVALETPETQEWELAWLGPNVAAITFGDGSSGTMVRC